MLYLGEIKMLCYLILMCAIGVQFACCHEEKVILTVANKRIEMGHNSNTTLCIIIDNNNKTYIHDKVHVENSNLPKRFAILSSCEVSIEYVTLDDTGIWTVTSQEDPENKTTMIHLLVMKAKIQTTVLPATKITISSNKSVTFYMPKVDETTTSCLLLYEEKIIYNITENKTDFIQSHFDCGVQFKVNQTHNGHWTLLNIVSGGKMYYGPLFINVTHENINTVTEITKYAIRGASNYKIRSNVDAWQCVLIDPYGNTKAVSSTDCNYNIPLLTLHDVGIWTMYYHLKNDHKAYTIKLTLAIYEALVESSVIYNNENKMIHLLCSLNNQSRISFCDFEHPNGTTYVMYNQIGGEKYEYYGNGFHNSEYHECGMTIRNPIESDYGTWRCHVKIMEPSIETGSILQVRTSEDKNDDVVINKDVHAIRDQPLKISCKINEIIRNCWMTSPNGSFYVIDDKNGYSDIEYQGRGFTLGDCGILIPNATKSDSGNWKCEMKLLNEKRVESRISVYVVEYPVIPKQDKIIYTGSPITLSCIVIPGEIFDIDVCRWIKPDGNGIHYESDERYLLESDHRQCTLLVTDENVNGNWSCVVQTNIGRQEAYKADIQVFIESPSNILMLVGSLSIISVFLAAIITFYLCKRTKKNVITE